MNNPADSNVKASLTDYLAAERTLLAWLRTGLALMGFGFVVARFGLFLQEIQAARGASSAHVYGSSLWFGTALIGVGVFLNALSGYRHLKLVRRLDRGDTTYSHPTMQVVSVAFFLALVGAAMAFYLFFIKR